VCLKVLDAVDKLIVTGLADDCYFHV